jgi:hypothetical protein
MPIEEVLPVGVGRVPAWWMEITPHYVLDEDEEVVRRTAEDQMAFYYMQLAAADDAGVLLPDGTPKLGPDLQPLSWTPTTPWNKLDPATAGSASGHGPGGRNFKPGHPVIDPKLFGIMETDPDYQNYLTGAKLPPGYFQKMGELAQSELGGTEGILNNLRQTDYGRYGRQAEAPNFKPSWAKKKLRSTETGASIRQGQYNDSPNKFINQQRRRIEANEAMPKLPSATSTTSSAAIATPQTNHPIASIHDQIKKLHIDTPAPNQVVSEQLMAATCPAPDENQKKKMVRKVRKVRKKESTPTSVFLEKPTTAIASDTSVSTTIPRYTHSDYYYNAKPQPPPVADTATTPMADSSVVVLDQERELAHLKEQQEKLRRLQELQKQQQLLREHEQATTAAADAPSEPEYDEVSYEEEVLDEDYIDGDEYSEGSYEEEVIYDDDYDEDNGESDLELHDLQAILAAKQAELQRLTQQLQ